MNNQILFIFAEYLHLFMSFFFFTMVYCALVDLDFRANKVLFFSVFFFFSSSSEVQSLIL